MSYAHVYIILSASAVVYTLYMIEAPISIFSIIHKIQIFVTNRRINRPLFILRALSKL